MRFWYRDQVITLASTVLVALWQGSTKGRILDAMQDFDGWQLDLDHPVRRPSLAESIQARTMVHSGQRQTLNKWKEGVRLRSFSDDDVYMKSGRHS